MITSNVEMGLDCLQYPILRSIGRLNVDLALTRVVGESTSEGKDRQDPQNIQNAERCAGHHLITQTENRSAL